MLWPKEEEQQPLAVSEEEGEDKFLNSFLFFSFMQQD